MSILGGIIDITPNFVKYTQSISKSLEESRAVKSKERTQPYVTETEARRLANQEFERRRVYAIDIAESNSVSTQLLTLQYGAEATKCELVLTSFSACLPENVVSGINLAIAMKKAKCLQQCGDACCGIRAVIEGLTPAVQNNVASLLVPAQVWLLENFSR